jgi:hypothetical protein
MIISNQFFFLVIEYQWDKNRDDFFISVKNHLERLS